MGDSVSYADLVLFLIGNFSSSSRSMWVQEKQYKVFVRKSTRADLRSDKATFLQAIDVASIEVHVLWERKGICTRIFEEVERAAKRTKKGVFVESVSSPILAGFLERRNYLVHKDYTDYSTTILRDYIKYPETEQNNEIQTSIKTRADTRRKENGKGT